MPQKFTDPRLVSLNDDHGFVDSGMRRALCEALEAGETAVASYSVSAHIWVEAVLTDRALLLVKGAVRAKVTRVPLPLEVTRAPGGSRRGVRLRTPLGQKTLWGSKLDDEARLLLGVSRPLTARPPAHRNRPSPLLRDGRVDARRAKRRDPNHADPGDVAFADSGSGSRPPQPSGTLRTTA